MLVDDGDTSEVSRDTGSDLDVAELSTTERGRDSSSGFATKSLYELSDIRGAFHGNRRRVMQQNMMARDQMSVG